MRTVTRRTLLSGLSALAVMPAVAAAWPERPIMLVIGFPAGGPTDIVGRILAQALSARLGQAVVVENRAGASGMTAAGQIARAQPDGYSLIVSTSTFPASAAMLRQLPFRPVEDFSTISTIVEFPYVVVTYPEHQIRNIEDLVKAARTQSGSAPLTFGTSGVGSTQHLAFERFAKEAGVHFQHVPFRGGAPAITELLAKRLDLVIDQPSALVEMVREGRLRALAVTGSQRFFSLPDVPTISESGFPGYAVTGWQGLVGPAGLPSAVVERLHGALAQILEDPAVVQQLRTFGNEPKLSTPDEMRNRIAAEIAMWTQVIADAKIERI